MEGNLILHGEHTIQYMHEILLNCMFKTYKVLLTNITPNKFNLKKKKTLVFLSKHTLAFSVMASMLPPPQQHCHLPLRTQRARTRLRQGRPSQQQHRPQLKGETSFLHLSPSCGDYSNNTLIQMGQASETGSDGEKKRLVDKGMKTGWAALT